MEVADLALDELGSDLIQSLAGDELANPEFADLDDLSSFIQPAEPQAKSSIPGLNFLLTNVIGEEDDESVVEYIKKARTAVNEDAG